MRRVAEFLDAEQRPCAMRAMLEEFYADHGGGGGGGGADGLSALLPLAHSETSTMRTSLGEIEARLRRRVVMVSPALLA